MSELNEQTSSHEDNYPADQEEFAYRNAEPELDFEKLQDSVSAGQRAFVRSRTPRKTAGTIDDLAAGEESFSSYTHDSNISVGGGVFSGGHNYRRSRRAHNTVQKGAYGQYLEIPKGKRSIFSSREHERRTRSTLAIAALIVAVILLALILKIFL